jgi:hypothetical protein
MMNKERELMIARECINEVTKYHSTTICDGLIPENPSREHYEELAYIKGINEGYNDAVAQIFAGLTQYFGVDEELLAQPEQEQEPVAWSDEEIKALYDRHAFAMESDEYMWGFRDAEKAHGIGGGE